jgi:hypothetical protein
MLSQSLPGAVISFGGPTLIIAPCDASQALLTQPALSLWRLKNKKKTAMVVAKKQVAAIYSAMPEINEVIIAPERLFGADGLFNFLSRLKKHTFEDSYLLCNRFSARALTTALTINRRHPFKKISAANNIFGHRSEDYAALLLNLGSVAEVPINLPVPTLRADGLQQRRLLTHCGIEGELFGSAGQVSKLRSQVPIFVVQLANTASVSNLRTQILDLCLQRWSNAQIAMLNGNEIELFSGSKYSHLPRLTANLTVNDKLALISLAALVITDETFLVQLSDAFCTPVVCLETDSIRRAPRWPSHQGRFAQSSVAKDEILQCMEKVLRFDRQHQRLSKTI